MSTPAAVDVQQLKDRLGVVFMWSDPSALMKEIRTVAAAADMAQFEAAVVQATETGTGTRGDRAAPAAGSAHPTQVE